jgi:hypothetical protein
LRGLFPSRGIGIGGQEFFQHLDRSRYAQQGLFQTYPSLLQFRQHFLASLKLGFQLLQPLFQLLSHGWFHSQRGEAQPPPSAVLDMPGCESSHFPATKGD